MGIDTLFRKWFDKSVDEVRAYKPIVDKINALEPEFESLPMEAFLSKSADLKKRVADGASLDDVLPEAFAAVREISKRALHMRHFDVQLLGGMVLHSGKIAEMKTGEGKTLVAPLALYLNALTGRGAHLVTVNDYLARRDAVWMGPIFHHLGMSVGIIQGQSQETDELGGSYIYTPGAQHEDPRYMNLVPCSRRDAYVCDIVYGTNHEFGFDYMRDNMVFDVSELVMRELHFAIVDEVDSILVDEARTPHIISGASQEPIEKYIKANDVVRRLVGGDEDEPGIHYKVNKKDHAASLTEEGYDKVEELLGIPNLAGEPEWMHYINAAVKAHGLFDKDVEYVVKDGQVILVDENTGRLMFGRRLSEGLHQALEAKEGMSVQRESQSVAVITFQNLFRLYEKLAGMTGTAKTEEDEFRKIYGLEVVAIPTHRDMIRTDNADIIYKTEEAKFRGVAKEIFRLYSKQQPVLVGTRSIEMSERLSARLTSDKLQTLALAERIKHHVENEKGVPKDKKNAAFDAILVPLTEAKQKTLQGTAKDLGLPSDPLGNEMLEWLLSHFGLGEMNKQYLDEALRHGVPHKVLNAKFHEREALIIAEAGRKGSVTIATNMAGRGVDILLGGRVSNDEIELSGKQDADDEFTSTFANFRRGGKERAAPPLPLDEQERKALADEVRELGGLYILGSERHESRRIDNQLRGRAGRQGDPGESRYFVSLEDQLWKIFNAKMMENPLLRAWPDLEEVNAKFLSSMIEKTQKRIESHFFEYRKHVLEYDDVLNAQREHIYDMRRQFLLGKDPRETIRGYVSEALDTIVHQFEPDGIDTTEWPYGDLFRELLTIFPAMDYGSPSDLEGLKTAREISEKVNGWASQAYDARIDKFGEDFPHIEKFVLLRAITQLWTEHLQNVERLREGIGLRGYGQVDPLIAFRKESHTIFEETLNGIRDQVAQFIYRVEIQREAAPAPQMQRLPDETSQAPTNGAPQNMQPLSSGNGRIDWTKVKRNDLCPCGSGKKFKHCHYREVVG